jgi:hypothetical protein
MFKSIFKSLGYIKESDIFCEVSNKDPYITANKKYYKVSVRGEDYLFTENNLEIARNRAKKNPEDL